jgi:hypothetical protein
MDVMWPPEWNRSRVSERQQGYSNPHRYFFNACDASYAVRDLHNGALGNVIIGCGFLEILAAIYNAEKGKRYCARPFRMKFSKCSFQGRGKEWFIGES